MKTLQILFLFLNIFLIKTLLSPECQLPKTTGPCKAAFKRFYYNIDKNLCEPFIYGGCQGNENNFQTLNECQLKCFSEERILNQVGELGISSYCLYPPESGPCKAYFVRYYYDDIAGKCENFVYGGCGGNENNFEDFSSCMQACYY